MMGREEDGEEESLRCSRTRGEALGNEVLMMGVGEEEERGEVRM